jgi:hypothetical protein
VSAMRRSFAALLLGYCAFAATAQTHEVPAELWDRPRTANAIALEESVKRAVAAVLDKPEAQLVIHHAVGQEPMLQAEELKSWLGALAIDTRRIALRSDLAAGAPIRIEVIP